MRAIKVDAGRAAREIQVLVRTFPSLHVVFTRPRRTWTGTLGQGRLEHSTIVYKGEALVFPSGGDVQRFGLGQTEQTIPSLIIVGAHDIRQGDFVVLEGVLQQVEFAPVYMAGLMMIKLQQYEQKA